MWVSSSRTFLGHLGRLASYAAIGVAFNDCVIGITFTDDKYVQYDAQYQISDNCLPLDTPCRPNVPIVVEKWRLLFRGPEHSIQREDEVVIIDPFMPKRRVVRRVVAMNDDYVSVASGVVVYHARVEDGCYFLVDETKKGMVSI